MEKNFTNEDSLRLIQTMVGISRQNFREGGVYYILYGSVFFVASLVQYVLYSFYDSIWHWTSWLGAGILAGVLSVLLNRKRRGTGRVTTYLSRLNRFFWTGFVFCILFIVFLAYQDSIPYTAINPLIIMLYGLAALIMGGMLKFRWLVMGAVAALVIAVICSFQEYSMQMLLVSLTILLSYLIPGLMLNFSREGNA